MRLSDTLFDQIVGCVAMRIEDRPAERRGTGRVRLPTRVYVIPLSKRIAAHPAIVQVRDLSHEGIGLLLTNKLMPDDGILVRLQTTDKNYVWIHCAVKRSERVAEALYVTGAQFMRVVDPRVAGGVNAAPEKV